MLTEQDFLKIDKQAIGIYQNLELQIIEEIAIRIANYGYANTVAINNMRIAQEMGFLYQDIIRLVAEYNNTTEEEVNRIFYEAGEKSLKFDDEIYKEAGLNPLPLKQSESIKQIIVAGPRYLDSYIRLLMAGIDKEKIIHEKDEIEATSHLKIEGIDKVFILHDLYSIEETKRIKAKVKEIIDNKWKGDLVWK